MMPVPQEMKGAFASGGGHDVEPVCPQVLGETLPQRRVGIGNEDALVDVFK
jgi:hypothetical protein